MGYVVLVHIGFRGLYIYIYMGYIGVIGYILGFYRHIGYNWFRVQGLGFRV